jgi:hypothetical protein
MGRAGLEPATLGLKAALRGLGLPRQIQVLAGNRLVLGASGLADLGTARQVLLTTC